MNENGRNWSATKANFNRHFNFTFKFSVVPCQTILVAHQVLWLYIMPRVSNVQKARAIGQIEAEMLQKDNNARPHRARLVRNFLEREGITRMDWPACSPDLNPIEHLWDQLGRAVGKRVTNATTLAGLRQILVDEWNAIPQQRITKLINSMWTRCQAVVQALGSSTRY